MHVWFYKNSDSAAPCPGNNGHLQGGCPAAAFDEGFSSIMGSILVKEILGYGILLS
ncbi:MAG: hypothetical protein ABIA04_11875 [Pseudomonadota bacterium]